MHEFIVSRVIQGRLAINYRFIGTLRPVHITALLLKETGR